MTTEPKDVRGGDEAKRSALTPSDPPPVREAVAWRYRMMPGGEWAYREYDTPVGDLWCERQPLYADPLPVSREAISRELHSLDCALGQLMKCETAPDWVAYRAKVKKHRANIDAILALTGETSRE